MAFNRFRPTCHFIAPHSWANDPCGAVYVPETKEYIVCYQWNPGTTEGGNCAWGMARSKDSVTWEDCPPAIRNGLSYDALGVFSGSIVSRLVDGKRVLFLFYTSVAALPIHWSKPYIQGCESQSVAISTDLGRSWHRSCENPLLSVPPLREATTGWRDPFVSHWPSLSTLMGFGQETSYMMIASGERGQASQLHLYRSDDLCDWQYLSLLLDVERGSKVSKNSHLRWGENFECASFFSAGRSDYIMLGVEEDEHSRRHNGHCTLWLSGALVLKDGKPRFDISGHGLADHGISYAPHIFRDSEDRLLQLGWADEAAEKHVVTSQGWAGCLAHPRELFEISKPIDSNIFADDAHAWTLHPSSGVMTTLGIRPAPQVADLRRQSSFSSLSEFVGVRTPAYEVEATFFQPKGTEKFVFNVLESPGSVEVTKLIFDLGDGRITVDRSKSSRSKLGADFPDSGSFRLLPGEDLRLRIFVDVSLVELYANDRFALTSRVYPSLDTSRLASYDFGTWDEANVKFECWEDLKAAWPSRKAGADVLQESCLTTDMEKQGERVHVQTLAIPAVAAIE
ncbi:Arabinanase/levansucrase/invertase [Coniochaeta hoffmannii]|uniref:Arabinanase/levansucrase/invertase n=1 Tax=Coniochaeta hoffmannii TaxID=91930 RepID=A0AA38VRM9_9PEZI|nr:Arabinanase/levansucrase/invertase [Coniochaeta hoffmannii]